MKKPKFTQAFTIIELTTVMVIIMIIAGLIVGVGRSARIAAMEAKAKSMIAGLEVAISMYHTDTGEFPGAAALYSDLTTYPGVTGWRGPYMEFDQKDISGSVIMDPWGKAYNYDASPPLWGNTNSYNLWSNGPDENDDSSDGDTDYGDDVYNW